MVTHWVPPSYRTVCPLKGEIPSAKVYENEFVYAFRDINPQAPVHILIVPKKHVESCAVLGAEDEVGAEVLVTNDTVVSQFGWSALEEDTPFEKEVGAVGDAECFLHVMVGDKDAYVPVFEFPDDILDVLHSNGVDAGDRVVELDELRVDGKATRYLRPSSFAT